MSTSEWIGAATNVFSAVGTVGAFAVAMYLLRQDQRREDARSAEQRRSQAVKVSAWLEAQTSGQGARELFFHVHNASDMPIYEVSLPSPEPDGDDAEAEFIGLIPPGRTVQRAAPKAWLRTYFTPEPVQIEFLDSGGRRWQRDEDGTLSSAATRLQA